LQGLTWRESMSWSHVRE